MARHALSWQAFKQAPHMTTFTLELRMSFIENKASRKMIKLRGFFSRKTDTKHEQQQSDRP